MMLPQNINHNVFEQQANNEINQQKIVRRRKEKKQKHSKNYCPSIIILLDSFNAFNHKNYPNVKVYNLNPLPFTSISTLFCK